jgi:hypothetical protein
MKTLRLLPALLFLLIGFLAAARMGHAQSSPQLQAMLEKYSSKTEAAGGGGGDYWEDPRNVVMTGPITKVAIRHGSQIDNIQFFYGGSPGNRHGGNGGMPTVYEVEKGFEIVKIIGRAGSELDAIQFVCRNADGDFRESPVYGGTGGEEFIIAGNDDMTVPLRWVKGRAGSKIDQLEFTFGYPMRISDVQIDQEALEAQLFDAKPMNIDNFKYPNRSNKETTVTYRLEKTVASKHTFTMQSGLKFTLGQTIKIKPLFGFMAEATVNWSIETSYVFTNSIERTETNLRGWATTIPIPANQEVKVAVISYQKDVDVPMHYRISLMNPATGQEVAHVIEQGNYKGVLYSSLTVDPSYYDLDGNPLGKDGPPAEQPRAEAEGTEEGGGN